MADDRLTGGELLGQYRVEAEIATGGMGVVYQAHDTKLRRPVAIKLLREGGEDERRARVLREARAASRLSHPNICTVYEVGEQKGCAFIVMELIEGRSLRDAIPSTGLSVDSVLRYGVQIADALAHAHRHGVVHRDLKSANIIVTPAGRVKVLDFGVASVVARAIDEATRAATLESEAPAATGTLAYMAPETLRGEPATPRTDVWSVGVVLFEMAAGSLPFQGRTGFELTSGILKDNPAPVPLTVPAPLTRIILRCLKKEAAERYDDAGEVLAALETISTGGEQESSQPRGERSIAVLPFRDLARDPTNAYLGLGLADATITELALVRSLLVRPTSAIVPYEGRAADPVQVGRELSVDAIVDGSFQRAGPRVRITVQLVSVADGRSLWSTKVNASIDDLFAMQDEVAREIVRALQVELSQADERRLTEAPRAAAPQAEAFAVYLQGRRELLRETLDGVNRAIELFEEAIQVDPGFARAYAGLADAYARLAFTFDPEGDWYERAQGVSLKALALDPSLPEGRYIRGRLLWCPDGGFDHEGALREFLAATAAQPNLNEAHHWVGIILLHISMLEESERRLTRALAINPDDYIASTHLATCRYYATDFAGALALSERAGQQHSMSPAWLSYQTGLCLVQLGRLEDAQRTADQATRRNPQDVLTFPVRGLIAARRGDRRTAEQQIELTIKHRKAYGHYHHAQYDVACIYAQLGHADEALRWLDDAARNGFPCYVLFENDPLLAPVRGDARFDRLMRELQVVCERVGTVYEAVGDGESGPIRDL